MEITIDEQKILKEILEFDGTLHQKIKDEVRTKLVDDIKNEMENTYFKSGWGGITEEIKRDVLEEIREDQEKIVKKILQDFYDSYRFGKKDITILKKLKELLGETDY